jgi:hypothetical protein
MLCIRLFIWFVTLPLYRNSNTNAIKQNNSINTILDITLIINLFISLKNSTNFDTNVHNNLFSCPADTKTYPTYPRYV